MIMLNKEYFFQGKSVLRKIKDKAFYDFLVAHQGAGDVIKYIPTGFYNAPNGSSYINVVKVIGGSIDMEYHLSTGGGYISESDWMLLFRERKMTNHDELLRRIDNYNEIVNISKRHLPRATVEQINIAQKALKNFAEHGMRK